MTNPARMRRSYGRGALDEADLAPSWLEQLQAWLADAVGAGVAEPNAIVLATATADGAPSARTVLLKGLDERGLVFFTNHGSRKGRELEENPRAAIVFPWHEIQRQVVVDGKVERLSPEESDAYFDSRPHAARIGALASPQSRPVGSRAELEQRYSELAERHPEDPPRPDWWGGLRVAPHAVEFWHGRRGRLHDRLRYRETDRGEWIVERLAP